MKTLRLTSCEIGAVSRPFCMYADSIVREIETVCFDGVKIKFTRIDRRFLVKLFPDDTVLSGGSDRVTNSCQCFELCHFKKDTESEC